MTVADITSLRTPAKLIHRFARVDGTHVRVFSKAVATTPSELPGLGIKDVTIQELCGVARSYLFGHVEVDYGTGPDGRWSATVVMHRTYRRRPSRERVHMEYLVTMALIGQGIEKARDRKALRTAVAA